MRRHLLFLVCLALFAAGCSDAGIIELTDSPATTASSTTTSSTTTSSTPSSPTTVVAEELVAAPSESVLLAYEYELVISEPGRNNAPERVSAGFDPNSGNGFHREWGASALYHDPDAGEGAFVERVLLSGDVFMRGISAELQSTESSHPSTWYESDTLLLANHVDLLAEVQQFDELLRRVKAVGSVNEFESAAGSPAFRSNLLAQSEGFAGTVLRRIRGEDRYDLTVVADGEQIGSIRIEPQSRRQPCLLYTSPSPRDRG